MPAAAAALSGGFADPAPDSARAFRAILQAMARPGTIQPAAGATPPAPVPPAMGLVALTLADADAPVWLSPRLAATDFPDWIRFHCGAPVLEDRAAAAFAFGAPDELGAPDDWRMGEAEYPDRGVTLVLDLAAFEGAALTLSGPGIQSTAALPLGPACAAIRSLTALNAASYPLGLDLILCAGDRVAALPRTTRLSSQTSVQEG